MRIVICFLLMVFLSSVASESCGDVGNFFVFRGSDSRLDGDVGRNATETIRDAWSRSVESADDMVFLIDISPTVPAKTYSIRKVNLVIDDTWPLRGYKIIGGDVDGLKKGIAEVKAAFRSGRIDRLPSGTREQASRTKGRVLEK